VLTSHSGRNFKKREVWKWLLVGHDLPKNYP
jgi:hypothetical protein